MNLKLRFSLSLSLFVEAVSFVGFQWKNLIFFSVSDALEQEGVGSITVIQKDVANSVLIPELSQKCNLAP